MDRTVTDDSDQEGECEHCVLRRCRSQHHQNKSPALNTLAKQETYRPIFEKCQKSVNISVNHYNKPIKVSSPIPFKSKLQSVLFGN